MPAAANIKFNGVRQGWGDLSFIYLGRTFTGITDMDIKGDREISNEYGSGSDAVHRSYGNRTYDGHTLTLYHYEVMDILASLPEGKDLSDIAPSDFTIVFTPSGSDTLRRIVLPYFQIKTSGLNISTKQNDKSIPIKLTAISGRPYYKK